MEEAIIDSNRSGDALRERFGGIARQFEPEILRHALRLCGNDLDWAKDLTQDALIAGYRLAKEQKLDFEGNVKAWFLRVVTTRFINEYNRKKRWQSDVQIDEPGLNVPETLKQDPFPSIDREVGSPFDDSLDQALRQLPEEQRLCVLLIDVEELSYVEASEYLDVPVGTVRSRLARGRIRLYSLLKPYAEARGII